LGWIGCAADYGTFIHSPIHWFRSLYAAAPATRYYEQEYAYKDELFFHGHFQTFAVNMLTYGRNDGFKNLPT
jgi:hypothetical protein